MSFITGMRPSQCGARPQAEMARWTQVAAARRLREGRKITAPPAPLPDHHPCTVVPPNFSALEGVAFHPESWEVAVSWASGFSPPVPLPIRGDVESRISNPHPFRAPSLAPEEPNLIHILSTLHSCGPTSRLFAPWKGESGWREPGIRSITAVRVVEFPPSNTAECFLNAGYLRIYQANPHPLRAPQLPAALYAFVTCSSHFPLFRVPLRPHCGALPDTESPSPLPSGAKTVSSGFGASLVDVCPLARFAKTVSERKCSTLRLNHRFCAPSYVQQAPGNFRWPFKSSQSVRTIETGEWAAGARRRIDRFAAEFPSNNATEPSGAFLNANQLGIYQAAHRIHCCKCRSEAKQLAPARSNLHPFHAPQLPADLSPRHSVSIYDHQPPLAVSPLGHTAGPFHEMESPPAVQNCDSGIRRIDA
ncbi:hypothetical protein BDK51DRAFT_36559 [Blyttiomyces helicus]|uniref:Uncharacterized protein n=1 Tax=Blyttiomyces helicus TaxID=388810 RepID=A0A4P9WGA2_9FUNG|nr:hypothetical protein BDK51DRAFT_36559 [Blyttiomyces helicus]|eukprot:RKO91724.1 hypothetical protein BDK51DRAFT_36559 [Blyttiomyces helicus]